MKFPITRETLQAFDYAQEQKQLQEEQTKKIITQILDTLCKEFERNMLSNSKEKKFVWRNIQMINNAFNRNVYKTYDEYVDQFLEKLKEIFIGCDIIIDPLKTYIIIDWS